MLLAHAPAGAHHLERVELTVLTGVKRLLALLDKGGRRCLAALALLSLASAACELTGVSASVPLIAVAARPEMLEQPGRLHDLYLTLGEPGARHFLFGLGALSLLMLTLSNLLTGMISFYGLGFFRRQQRILSLRLLRSFLSQDYAWHLSHPYLNLSHLLVQSRNLVESNFQPLVLVMTRALSVAALSAALLYVNAAVTLASVTLLLLSYGSIYVACRKYYLRASRDEWNLVLATYRTATEPLGGITQIKLGASEGRYLEDYDQQLAQLERIQRARQTSLELPRLCMHTLVYAGLLTLILALMERYGQGSEVVAQAAFFALAGFRLVPSIQQLFANLAYLESGRATVEALDEHFRLAPRPLPGPTAAPRFCHSLALRGVNFGYSHQPVLQDLDFTLTRGRWIGLVGASGCGKTTLVNLLVGLLRPQQGALLLDEVPLDEPGLRSLGLMIGYVPQDVYISDDTLLRNIALGHPELDEEAARKAARRALVDEFSGQLPQGDQTMLGERGLRLSGGQRQRVGIARALYGDPQILVLDEATSALDGATEARLFESLRDFARDRTFLIITHRLATLKFCDEIRVLSEGKVAAQGSYEELQQKSSEFLSLAGQRGLD